MSWVSEEQGATPAIRGLARGRALILVDGARVTPNAEPVPTRLFLIPAGSREWMYRAVLRR